MKTLIADIYNRIVEFFQSEKQGNTSECATNRLQVILMHDRTKLDPLIMNKMREELIEVFSKYVVIDKEELEIGLKNEGDAVALMLNIPVVRSKTEEELEEIRKKLQEEEAKVSDDDEEEEESDDEITEEEEEEEIVEGEVTEVEIQATAAPAEEVVSEEDEIVEEDEENTEKEDKE